MRMKTWIPWGMVAFRAALGPVVMLGERCGWNGVALAGMVAAALVSDIFDGVLARRWRCDTPAVRLFDSMADTVFYLGVGVALWLRDPQMWRSRWPLLAALLVAEALNFTVAIAKFGKPASYHSYLAKTWGLVLAVAVVMEFATAHAGSMIAAALGLGILCNLEGIAMSFVLPDWVHDVKTLVVAWRVRGRILRDRYPRRTSEPVSLMGR